MKISDDEKELVEYWDGNLAAVAISQTASMIEDYLEVLNDRLIKIDKNLERIKDEISLIPG